MDLNTLANLAEIIGVFTILGGLWFALVQLLSIRGQRRDMGPEPAFLRYQDWQP